MSRSFSFWALFLLSATVVCSFVESRDIDSELLALCSRYRNPPPICRYYINSGPFENEIQSGTRYRGRDRDQTESESSDSDSDEENPYYGY